MLGAAARVYLELDRQGDQPTTHPSQAHTFRNLQTFQQVFTVLGEGSYYGIVLPCWQRLALSHLGIY